MTISTIFEGLTITTVIALGYLFIRIFGSAKAEGAKEERIKGEIKGLQKQIDYLDEWRDEHIKTCTSEHKQIEAKVDRVHEAVGDLKAAVAGIEQWMRGRGPASPPPPK